jgi:anti-sigma regulatory factor (Ser/Thr protein kinase)
MRKIINITPSTKMVRSRREDTRLSLESVVNELVDNSFDAGATRVEIDVGDNIGIRVWDNGRGIRDIESALRFGESVNDIEGIKLLGRFGIALKRGPARLRELYIRSVNKNQKVEIVVDWRELEDSGSWESLGCDVEHGRFGPTFTMVCISHSVLGRSSPRAASQTIFSSRPRNVAC